MTRQSLARSPAHNSFDLINSHLAADDQLSGPSITAYLSGHRLVTNTVPTWPTTLTLNNVLRPILPGQVVIGAVLPLAEKKSDERNELP